MKKEQAKENIAELVKKYQRIAEAGKIKSYNEAQTRNEFIEPLFGFLGWDMRNANNDNEVATEEAISGSRVDLAFRINGIPKFFLEAKSLKSDLDIESYARQAINYSWNKGVNWAALTDFEGIKIFNANAKSKSLRDKMVFEISYDEYIQDFERLWLLSKESFEKNALDVYAEKHGKKSKSLTVNEKLFDDLKQAREILTKSFNNWKEYWDKHKDIDQETLDEGVQRILDRLVFIRVLEDRKLEEPILRPILREWEKDHSDSRKLFQMLAKKFRELDDLYNSSLFTKHACEDWEEYDGAIKDAINLLYGNDVYEYNFKEIPADILGGVYESYLGYIAQKPVEAGAEKKSGKLSKADDKKDLKIKSRKKRKEQGIYYTPNFIVDYIIKNTLGKKLEEIKNVNDLKQIKILDPACGSGSFLVKALEIVNEKYRDFNNFGDQYTKSGILLKNIYGVDLDPQAVELAKLNLLIGALDQKAKLPNLTDNIRIGNSLISGSEKELKKYFGKDWLGKKPFNWEEEFSDVFNQGGFDVIIGNPPYIRNRDLDEKDKKLFDEKYYSAHGQYDIYQLFFEQSIKLLKENGLLGFITSNKYAIAEYGKKLRELILDNCKIVSVIDVSNLQVFKDAFTYPYIIILQKTKNNSGNIIEGYKVGDELDFSDNKVLINQDDIKNSQTKNFVIKKELKFLKDIERKSVKLGEIATIKETIHTGNVRDKLIVDEKIDETCKKLLAGKDCHRYWFKWNGKYIRYDKNLIDKSKKEYANLCDKKYFEEPKILLREISLNIECCYDDEKYYTLNKVYSVQISDKYNLKYILALLNSKFLSFYFRNKFEEAHVSGGYLQFKKTYTSQLPIYKIDFSDKKEKAKHDYLVKLANQILNLNNQLQSTPENSDKWNEIKKEIRKVDGEIDKRVFELYGLGEEEIGIIEEIT